MTDADMKDFWNERYIDTEYVYGTKPNLFLVEELSKTKSGTILFPCEGEGRNAVYAAKKGWKVDAFDQSEMGWQKAMRLANENYTAINYTIVDAIDAVYPPNSFDVIALLYAHFPSETRNILHRKVISWLKPGGSLILEAFHPLQINNNSGGPRNIEMLYSEETLLNDFIDLDIKYLQHLRIDLDEGKFHQGKSDIIRFTGTKRK